MDNIQIGNLGYMSLSFTTEHVLMEIPFRHLKTLLWELLRRVLLLSWLWSKVIWICYFYYVCYMVACMNDETGGENYGAAQWDLTSQRLTFASEVRCWRSYAAVAPSTYRNASSLYSVKHPDPARPNPTAHILSNQSKYRHCFSTCLP